MYGILSLSWISRNFSMEFLQIFIMEEVKIQAALPFLKSLIW